MTKQELIENRDRLKTKTDRQRDVYKESGLYSDFLKWSAFDSMYMHFSSQVFIVWSRELEVMGREHND